MRFYSPKAAAECDPNFVELHCQLAQASSKPWRFWALTTLGAVALIGAQTGFQKQNGDFLGFRDLAIRGIALLVVGFVASRFFKFFNKI